MEYFILYMFMGLVSFILTSIVHIIRAVKKGYDINTVNIVVNRVVSKHGTMVVVKFIVGLIVWPIRFIKFMHEQKYLFNQYEIESR